MGDAYAMALYGYQLDVKRPGWVHLFRDNKAAIAWIHAAHLDPRAPKKKPTRYSEREYEDAFLEVLQTLEADSGFGDRLEPWHFRFAEAEGIALPAAAKGDVPEAARRAFLKSLAAALAAEPCTIVRVQYGFERSEEDYLVAPRASAVGDEVEHRVIPLPELKVDPAWDKQIDAFCKKLGLEPPKRRGWLMTSFAFN